MTNGIEKWSVVRYVSKGKRQLNGKSYVCLTRVNDINVTVGDPVMLKSNKNTNTLHCGGIFSIPTDGNNLVPSHAKYIGLYRDRVARRQWQAEEKVDLILRERDRQRARDGRIDEIKILVRPIAILYGRLPTRAQRRAFDLIVLEALHETV